jgi:hypothetical protein
MSQAAPIHYAQVTLNPGECLLLCGKIPRGWESALTDPTPTSMNALRRKLILQSSDDLNAVLVQPTQGSGSVKMLNGTAEPKEENPPEAPPSPTGANRPQVPESTAAPAHLVQPSAYAIPSQPAPVSSSLAADLPRPAGSRDFPASIPRAGASTPPFITETPPARPEKSPESITPDPKPAREPSQQARRVAKALAGAIQASRRLSNALGERLRNFLPRLLPNSETGESLAPSNTMMAFLAVLVPLIVVTIASVVYLRYGRSLQYETYLRQAQELRAQAVTLTEPVEQRKAWENVLLNVDIAESHRETSETITLRQEAESNLDALLGITRLQFQPAFSSNLGIEVSRMAASETDLFLLNAAKGEVLRAQLTSGRGFQLDTAFNCRPGVYGSYTVGPLVDILALPTLNSINATLLGVDAGGNLLYCAPGQVAQAIPLPVPDTNWGRVTAFVLDAGNLYVLDAPARAVWVYNGRDGTFIDQPYFFFGGQTPEKQDVIDLVVSGDDLYLLHADGHLSTCSYSRLESVPTRCQDPTPLVNPFAAYQDVDLFGAAHFTQMLFAAPPDQSILLLDADSQGVMRFAPRTLDLENQFRPTTGSGNPIPPGPVSAVTVGPNYVMYLAMNGQVYLAAIP